MCNQARVKPVFSGALFLALALMAACSRPASEPAPGTINPGDWGLITLETPDAGDWRVTINGNEYTRFSFEAVSRQRKALTISSFNARFAAEFKLGSGKPPRCVNTLRKNATYRIPGVYRKWCIRC
jgi:hypothetical protein